MQIHSRDRWSNQQRTSNGWTGTREGAEWNAVKAFSWYRCPASRYYWNHQNHSLRVTPTASRVIRRLVLLRMAVRSFSVECQRLNQLKLKCRLWQSSSAHQGSDTEWWALNNNNNKKKIKNCKCLFRLMLTVNIQEMKQICIIVSLHKQAPVWQTSPK